MSDEKTLSLQRAKDLVKIYPMVDTKSKRVELHKDQLMKAKIEFDNILPIEGKDGREVIKQRIEFLRCTIEDPTFEERYPHLDIEVLKWRNKDGLPILVPFLLQDQYFSIEVEYDAGRWKKHRGSFRQFPYAMRNIYGDVIKKLQSQIGPHECYFSKKIKTKFSGIIPQWVREKIYVAATDFTELQWLCRKKINIFIVAEADNWQEEEIKTDPLVVGYKAGCLWLICSFDETPLEEYVRREFAV